MPRSGRFLICTVFIGNIDFFNGFLCFFSFRGTHGSRFSRLFGALVAHNSQAPAPRHQPPATSSQARAPRPQLPCYSHLAPAPRFPLPGSRRQDPASRSLGSQTPARLCLTLEAFMCDIFHFSGFMSDYVLLWRLLCLTFLTFQVLCLIMSYSRGLYV